MCGICAVVSPKGLTKAAINIFRDLLILQGYRGLKGTGIFEVKKEDDEFRTKYYKHAVTPIEFFYPEEDDNKRYLHSMFDYDANRLCLVGHARSPTRGSVSVKNCHPFDFENTIGVHNGTIPWLEGMAKHDTDSEGLINTISNDGIDVAVQRAGEHAAIATAYFDRTTNHLCFFRNKERPLHLVRSAKGDLMAWSSEPLPLEYAFARAGVKLDETGILSLKSNFLWEYDLTKDNFLDREMILSRELKEPEKKVYKSNLPEMITGPFVPESRFGSGSGHNARLNAGSEDKILHFQNRLTTAASKVVEALIEEEQQDFLEKAKEHVTHWHHGFHGMRLTFGVAKKLLDKGCQWCSAVPELGHDTLNTKVRWISATDFLCEDCATNPDVIECVPWMV